MTLPQGPSPLLALPRELRDKIYHHAFAQCAFESRERDIAFKICYGRYGAGKKKPLWVLANKQILSEAVTQFYRHARLTVYWTLACDKKFINPIFPISRFEKLTLDMFLEVKSAGEKIEIGPGRKHLDFDPGLRRILKALERSHTHLRQLSIRFDIGVDDMAEEVEYHPLPNVAGIKEGCVDLSYLEAFGTSLDKVELTLGECQVMASQNHNQLEAYAVIIPLIKRELIRLVQAMVGGQGCTVKDYMTSYTYWSVQAQKRSTRSTEKYQARLALSAWRDFQHETRGDLYILQPCSNEDVLHWKCERTKTSITIPKRKSL